MKIPIISALVILLNNDDIPIAVIRLKPLADTLFHRASFPITRSSSAQSFVICSSQ